MKSSIWSSELKNKKLVLSTLWVFVLMNMVYADIIGTMRPGYIEDLEYMSTELSGELVMLFGVFMEMVIIMIPLARFLNRKPNRIAHFIAVPFSILWVIVPALLSSGTQLSYIFFATVEVATMLFMLWFAWNWEEEK